MSDYTIMSRIQELLSSKYTDGISICYGNTHINKQYYYGNLSGDQERPISHETYYDLASVTKMLTTIAVLKLCEQNRLDLDAELGSYISDYPFISHLKIYELLNFSKGLRTEGRIDSAGSYENALLCLKTASVASDTPMYNDIGMIVISMLIDHIESEEGGFEHYCENLWKSIGLYNTYWWHKLPSEKKNNLQCYDYEYRLSNSSVTIKRTPFGQCHDGTAAILKSCGHAGVVSTPQDMVILSRKLLSGEVLSKDSIEQWTSSKYISKNDKPQFYGLGCYRKNPNRSLSEIPESCSDQSIAISGYTGTYLLLCFSKQEYCFIGSNRIYRRLTRNDKSRSFDDIQTECNHEIICDSSKYVYIKDQLVDACIEDLSE